MKPLGRDHLRLGEKFFRYLKERAAVFHHKLSARNHVQGIKNLNLFLRHAGGIDLPSGHVAAGKCCI